MISTKRTGSLTAGLLAIGLAAFTLSGCGDTVAEDGHGHAEEEGDHEEAVEGPNGGRLLEDGAFAVEISVFEAGEEPRFRVYASEDGKPVPADQVTGTVETKRLSGRVDTYNLQPTGDFLVSDAEVGEPHSFDVTVNVTFNGTAHTWSYESFEGRTVISAEAATEAGVEVAAAGPARIAETVELSGRATLSPSGRAEVKAWYPGRVTSVKVNVGERVKKGDAIATVEARDSLKVYTIEAPIGGLILERALNIGDVADQQAIVVIGDPTALLAELHVFPRDAERVRAGQAVTLRSLSGGLTVESKIDVFLPAAEASTQTVTARAALPNPDEAWRAGMAIEGRVTVATSDAAVAVKASAIQQMNGMTVVFLQSGDIYEAQPVTIGRSDGVWTEIVEGLDAGQTYVSGNSFLIRADIEKSGAAHDH